MWPFVMLKFFSKINRITDVRRNTACNTNLIQCFESGLAIFTDVRAIEISTFFHTFDFLVILIEVVNGATADWTLSMSLC